MKYLIMAGALVSCTVLACDDTGCTDVGCDLPLSVRLTTPVAGPGAYEVVREQDGSVERCAFEMDDDPPRGVGQDCGPFFLGFDGSGALTVIQMQQASRLTVSVLRDGAVIGRSTLTPDYENQELNGPGCGSCPFAREDLDVPAATPE